MIEIGHDCKVLMKKWGNLYIAGLTQNIMRTFLFLVASLGILTTTIAQQTITATITHDGLDRSYILYVPASYSPETEVPLIFNFHGYTSSATSQMGYGDFRPIADTAGFIVVHPQGTLLDGKTHWNVGGWTTASTVDDVGFTLALLDSLSDQYNINPDRVYSTGMSNGGYMSFLLACQASDRFAAIASVTGSMTPETYSACNPQHPTPVLQIHGTSDGTVPYGGAVWTKSIDDVVAYWKAYNQCDSAAMVVNLPDSDPNDGSTVEEFLYGNGDNGVSTIHLKIDGGGHTWPGTAFASGSTNQDFNASERVWNFFAQYDLNGLMNTTGAVREQAPQIPVSIFPNPSDGIFQVRYDSPLETHISILTLTGQSIYDGIIQDGSLEIDMVNFPDAMYLFRVGNQVFRVYKG